MAGRRGDWQNDRMRTTYREARAVIEAQNDTMSAIDRKAMRTVRFNVLLIGLLLTGFQVAGAETFHPELLITAITVIVLSVVLGTVTFNESDLFVGPAGTYLEELASGVTQASEWDRDLIQSFAGMISENADEIGWNSWLLTWSQLTMILGVIIGVISILIS